jgi:ADP-ribose pyrophosphatase YjhB (NUDIX family)
MNIMVIPYTPEDIVNHHSVMAVIKNAAGEILMQEHVKYGFWTLPVGKAKDGQDIKEGIEEEMLEECNLKLEEYHELVAKDYTYEREGKGVNVTGHIFEVTKYSGEMKNMEPHKQKQQLFLSFEDIKKLPFISDMTQLYLEQLGYKREVKI